MEASTPIPLIRERALAYRMAPTFAEYLISTPSHRVFLETRLREIRIPPEDQLFFVYYPDTIYLLAVVAEDSPETCAILPILAQICALSPRLNLRILRADSVAEQGATFVDDPALEATLAEADLPLVLALDEEWQIQDQWGPHPLASEPYLERWLAAHPEFEALAEDETPPAHQQYLALLEQLMYEMRLWYNSELNRACVQELRAWLAGLQDEGAGDEAEE